MSVTTSTKATAVCRELEAAVTAVVAIPPSSLEPLWAALFAGGHVLLEGIPGIGKTLLARTLARCVDCEFNRIQFTNDLMPSDIVGSMMWKPRSEEFEFSPGPLFSNLVLADEINRTSPRTLSCLLEAMESGTVTIEGRAMTLGEPFFVVATRNGIEFHGTYPIPEAALDRFMARVELGYPDRESELELYRGCDPEDRLAATRPVLDRATLNEMRQAARQVTVRANIAAYCHSVIEATRQHDEVLLGASPRAAITWLHAARARAMLDGRDYVLPDDLKALASAVLAHRVFMRGAGDAAALLTEILARVPVPL